jgi:hypothetical protein
MSTHPKIVTYIFLYGLLVSICFVLSACETFPKAPTIIQRLSLDVNVPKPLKPRSVVWNYLEVEGEQYFALDYQNYENLVKNAEDVQNRLYLQTKIIENQQTYYQNQ